MEPVFAEAERVVQAFFADWHERVGSGPQGTLGSGYVLIRGASLSVAFFNVVRDLFGAGRADEADAFSRNLLFDLAHAVGRSDAQAYHERMGVTDPIARLSAGPIHFAMTGWAYVHIHPDSRPTPDDTFFLLYDHEQSFEADAWLENEQPSEHPVCIMNAGYSSGWCEESFGIRLIATELSCRGAGHERCRFAMGHPQHLSSQLRSYSGRETVVMPELFRRKRLEAELRQSRDDLELRVAERTAELKEANRGRIREIEERRAIEEKLRTAQKLDAVGRLAGGVAHDFNNLLTVVLGSAEMLAESVEDPDARELIEHIRTAGERAADLTQQLLAVGRRQARNPQGLDLNEIVRGMARMFQRVLRADISLKVDLTPTGAPINADAGQIEQVLLNLVVNARDAMPGGGTLLLSTQPGLATAAAPGQTNRFVTLHVQDNGVGMDRSTMARIFEPFFTTKRAGQGTGLGLAMVYGIVEQSGGHIEVESTVGEGTSFTIAFPVASSVAKAEPSRSWPRASRDDASILVVEDEPALLEIARLSLTHCGYRVHVASDAEEAWRHWRDHTVDLLFTDVRMPGISGVELATRCRTERSDLPILFASGYAEEEVLQGAPTHRTKFLAKPYRPSELLPRVAELLDESTD
jgi:signal transduction histidine kinase